MIRLFHQDSGLSGAVPRTLPYFVLPRGEPSHSDSTRRVEETPRRGRSLVMSLTHCWKADSFSAALRAAFSLPSQGPLCHTATLIPVVKSKKQTNNSFGRLRLHFWLSSNRCACLRLSLFPQTRRCWFAINIRRCCRNCPVRTKSCSLQSTPSANHRAGTSVVLDVAHLQQRYPLRFLLTRSATL